MADEVIEASAEPIEEAVVEAPEAPADPGISEQPEGEQPEAQPDPKAAAPASLVIGGQKLAPEAEKLLGELKATNPALARSLRTALFQQDRFAREIPGGWKEVAALRDTVEQLGGENGIQGITQELDGWHQFDQQYTSGDPKALEFLMQSPETQDAFLKLAPMAFQKFAELHPDGYAHQVCAAAYASMRDSEIPLALKELAYAIGDTNPRAADALKQIQGYVDWMREKASKAPEAPKRAQADPRGNDLETRERSLTQREWMTETGAATNKLVEGEFARLAQGRTITAGNKAAIQVLYQNKMERVTAPGTVHHQRLQSYLAAGDREGFRRYSATVDRTEAAKALKAAFDEILPGKPGPKPAAKPAEGAAAATPGKAANGFTWTGKMPTAAEINMGHPFNTSANFLAGKAVLKDNRRVQWK